jgi:rSAM/selenodomain-associated transferase 1
MRSSNENKSHPAESGCTLVVMAKAPRTGSVKTRLTNAIPIGAVTELYRCLLDDTVALAKSLDSVEVAIVCPAADVKELTGLTRGTVDVVAQTGDGLAAGLISVFAHFTARGRQRVVAFNSDSPHLPVSVLTSAFETLASQDVVVGPTHDGGYYLVGARASHPSLFDDDGMGTRSALEALLVRARELQLSVGFTESFYDIDVEADLIRLAEELRFAPDRAPRTAAWLNAWAQTAAKSRTSAAEL